MKSIWKHVLVPLAVVLTATCGAFAQTPTGSNPPPVNSDQLKFNHGPCDWNDAFYQGIPGNLRPDGTQQNPGNGVLVTPTTLDSPQAQRFGIFRQFGPPATGMQKNWVNDPSCSENNPDTTNVRILATTGGYPDSAGGVPFGELQPFGANQFISIIAFLTNQNFFTGIANPRNIQMTDIVANFEAYAALKQVLPNGTFATQPCGSMGQTGTPSFPGQGTGPCFPVTSVATPQLRQDWRFATNRNAIDGSDNNDPFGLLEGTPGAPVPFDPNTIPGTGGATNSGTNNSPFGYFCDDVIGLWIVTYFWLPINPNTVDPTSACGQAYAALDKANGKSLDGSPIMKSGDDLNNLEAVTQDKGPSAGLPCAQEGKLAMDGSDGGAIWIVCPTIPDPRNGAITSDAFLDQVKLPNGQPLDQEFNANFNCLQQKGQYPTITAASGGWSGTGGGGGGGGGTTVTRITASNGTPEISTCQSATGQL